MIPIALALARRSLVNIFRIPAAFIPIVAMPLFFVISFSGSFSSLTRLPSFPTDNILSWMVPFAILQGAAFAGFSTGFGTVRDIDSGFYPRLLLSPGGRLPLLLGNALSGMVRATITLTVVLVFGLALGAAVPGGVLGIATLWTASVGIAFVAIGWALGVVYRVQSNKAGAILQLGIFATMFLSTGNVPLDAQAGWTRHVARVNPITNVLELARQGFIGDVSWSHTWPGLLAIAGMGVVLWTFAATGIRRLTP